MPTKAPAAILGVGLNCPMVICFDSESARGSDTDSIAEDPEN